MKIYHVTTKSERKDLLEALRAKGFKWSDGWELSDQSDFLHFTDQLVLVVRGEGVSHSTLDSVAKMYPSVPVQRHRVGGNL